MTPEQQFILDKLRNMEKRDLVDVPGITTPVRKSPEWRQRRVRNDIVLWVIRTGGSTFARVTLNDNTAVSGVYAVTALLEVVHDFDKIATKNLSDNLKNRDARSRLIVERLLRRYSPR